MQNDWEEFATETYQAVKELEPEPENGEGVDATEMPPVKEREDYSGGSKVVSTKARIGQGFFRKAVLSAYDYRCCISGLSVSSLLIASHIIPWRVDKANQLNPRNGLALSVLHDKAFDIGLITIREDMTVQVFDKIQKDADRFCVATLLNFEGKPISLPDKFQPHADFLSYHRNNIILGA